MDHVGVRAREESAKLVVAKIREMCGPQGVRDPHGRFQRRPEQPHLYDLHHLGDTGRFVQTAARRYAPNGTFNNFNPTLKTDSRIDHIFVSPSVRVHDYGVLTDTYRSQTTRSDEEIKSGAFPKEVSLHSYEARTPSDHFPVVVRLEF